MSDLTDGDPLYDRNGDIIGLARFDNQIGEFVVNRGCVFVGCTFVPGDWDAHHKRIARAADEWATPPKS